MLCAKEHYQLFFNVLVKRYLFILYGNESNGIGILSGKMHTIIKRITSANILRTT